MKKTIKLALVAALALGATSAFATNGSNLIGMGVKARSMGGIGVGMYHGAESGLSNPALISQGNGTQVSFGGTIFMPDVKNTNGVNMGGNGDQSGSASSKADLSVIPEISITSKVNENFSMGVGMWGTAGMGVDYRDAANQGQMNMVTNLQLMQFGVPLAYEVNNFSIGITPLLQYGSLDINYVLSKELQGTMVGDAPTAADMIMGHGVAQDLKFGYNLGVAYKGKNYTVGAVYKSQIDMQYKNVLSTTVAPFTGGLGYDNDKLSTPAEISVGASYTMGEHTIAVDYKQVQWSKTLGYKDFEWNDQDVYAVGYQYATDGWSLRLGYNQSKSPIEEQTVVNPATDARNSANLQPGGINTFNLLGFPGIVEEHYTIGGTYNLSDRTSFDFAYTIAPEVKETFKNFLAQDIVTKHSQTSLSFAANFNF